jgi:hypothetical protein
MSKPDKNKAKDELALLERQYGKLQFERETHIARLQDTERRMAQVKQQVIAIANNGKRDSS